jgi:hypothetical protein
MQIDSKTTPGDIPLYLVNTTDGTELVLVPGRWLWMGLSDEDSDGRSIPRLARRVVTELTKADVSDK